jgi:hypothetical protein
MSKSVSKNYRNSIVSDVLLVHAGIDSLVSWLGPAFLIDTPASTAADDGRLSS